MKTFNILFILTILFSFQACISDDFLDDEVDPVLRITSKADTIELNTSFQFEHLYLNNIGQAESIEVEWLSSDDEIISIDQTGLATALKLGMATIKLEANVGNEILASEFLVNVGASTTIVEEVTEIESKIQTTSSYVLTGDFIYRAIESDVEIVFAENYKASTALPGLYVYLSNNRNSIADALEIGKVEVFNGVHQYSIPNVEFSDYQYLVYFCKPFNVKVGDGEL